MTSLIVSSPPKYNSCDEISKISMLFFIIHIRPNLQSNFGNHTFRAFKEDSLYIKKILDRGV